MRLTDEQIVRVFQLCEEILAVRGGVPKVPGGFRDDSNIGIEIARNLRTELAQHQAALTELLEILAVAETAGE